MSGKFDHHVCSFWLLECVVANWSGCSTRVEGHLCGPLASSGITQSSRIVSVRRSSS